MVEMVEYLIRNDVNGDKEIIEGYADTFVYIAEEYAHNKKKESAS